MNHPQLLLLQVKDVVGGDGNDEEKGSVMVLMQRKSAEGKMVLLRE